MLFLFRFLRIGLGLDIPWLLRGGSRELRFHVWRKSRRVVILSLQLLEGEMDIVLVLIVD